MSDIQEYWNKWILEWEATSYEGGHPRGLIETLASRVREVNRRMTDAVSMISPVIHGKTVLDLGCGSGVLCALLLQKGAKEAWGVDFSQEAIQRATTRTRELNLAERSHFVCANVLEIEYPKADITVSLGLLDYLTPEQVRILFRKVRSPYYIFSFLQRRWSFWTLLHVLYTIHRKVPVVQRFTSAEITGLLEAAGHDGYRIDPQTSFITRLPPNSG